MRHRRRLVVPLVLLIVGIGVGGWFFLNRNHTSSGAHAKWVQPSVPPVDAKSAQKLADMVHSGEAKQLTQAMTLPNGTSLDAATLKSLHALRTVTLKPGSLRDNGNGTANADYLVVNSAGKSSTWHATLVWAGNAWKISLTTEA